MRSPAWTGAGCCDLWPSRRRMRHGRSRRGWWPINSNGSADAVGPVRRNRSGMPARRGAQHSRVPAGRRGGPWPRFPPLPQRRAWSAIVRCGQLPDGMLDGLAGSDWPPDAQVHVVIDDDGQRHVVRTLRQGKRAPRGLWRRWPKATITRVQRVGGRRCVGARAGDRVTGSGPATHAAACPAVWSPTAAQPELPGMTAWDLYGGAGLSASVCSRTRWGESGRVLAVDAFAGGVGRSACRVGRSAAGRRAHRFPCGAV